MMGQLFSRMRSSVRVVRRPATRDGDRLWPVVTPRFMQEVGRMRKLPDRSRPGSDAQRKEKVSDSGDGHRRIQEDVLDRVEQRDAVLQRPLERLAAGDEAGAAGALVDHGGGDGLLQVVLAGRAARVDQGDAAVVAVEDLVAGQVDRMVGGQLLVDFLGGLAELQRVVAAVVLRLLLLDDVRAEGDAEVVGLSGEVGRLVVVDLLLELRVAQVAPQHGEQAQLVRVREGLGDLLDLPVALVRPEVDGRADADAAHVPGLVDVGEEALVELVRVGQQLVVVQLEDEGDLVRVLAGDRAEHAVGGGHAVAAALDGEFDDVRGVEAVGIGAEGGAARVLHALVHGQQRQVAGAAEAAVTVQPGQIDAAPGSTGRSPW